MSPTAATRTPASLAVRTGAAAAFAAGTTIAAAAAAMQSSRRISPPGPTGQRYTRGPECQAKRSLGPARRRVVDRRGAQVGEVLELDPAPPGLGAGRPAERRTPFPVADRLVDVDAPRPKLVDEAERAREAVGVHGGLQAEVAVVREPYRVVIGVEHPSMNIVAPLMAPPGTGKRKL